MPPRSDSERHARHVKIISLFAKGYTIQRVAREIGVSIQTIKRDLREIARDNDIESVSTPLLIAFAVREGWIEEPKANFRGMLKDHERKILALVAKGYKNPQIAAQLDFTERKVKATLKQIYRKLGVKNRKQAATLVRKYALGD